MYESILFKDLERLELDLNIDIWALTVEELLVVIMKNYFIA